MKGRIVALLMAAGSAWAQAPIEARFAVGNTTFTDDSGSTHLAIAPSVRYYFLPRLAVEGEFQYLRQGSSHYDLVAMPSLVWDVRRGKVVPYLSIGAGVIHASFVGRSARQAFFQGGGGVKIFLNEHWYVAPEFKLGFELHARLSGAIGYRWGR